MEKIRRRKEKPIAVKLKERLDTLVALGSAIGADIERLDAHINRAYRENPWFEPVFIRKSLDAIREQFLVRSKFENWVGQYPVADDSVKTVGLVLAGNVPLVGFHDIIASFVAGHKTLIKPSHNDQVLTSFVIRLMQEINPEVENHIQVVEKLEGFDAVIATGSTNSSRYFEYYFGKYPHIIRKNRNSIAVLTGEEDEQDMRALCDDVFDYFGLGCRNVSKLYIHRNISNEQLLQYLDNKILINNEKYINNYNYNLSVSILNREEYQTNGSLIFYEREALNSRIATLHYETFDNLDGLNLEPFRHHIQCLVSNLNWEGFQNVDFGCSQQPGLTDYADNVDTMKFLTSL
jgi:hypothetical protein